MKENFSRRFHRGWARAALAGAAVLLLSVSGVTEEGTTERTVRFSDWPTTTAGEETGAQRVGSFRVGKPAAERFVGGLFEEWREIVTPALGGFDGLARERIRDEVFLNRETVDFNDYLRARGEGALLRLNQVSSDYLTDALVRRTEEGAEGYSFVRSVDLDYQSSVGGRRWQSGVNVLGALRETTDSALAWQLRGFAAEAGAVGSNFGLIYRQLAGEKNLLGVNTFVDYEDHDYGEFWRWSFGGELRGAWGGLFFNQYWAITGKQRFEDGGYYYDAYTRDGRDVALDLRMPYYDWLSGGLTYYHWRGEEGELDNGGTYKMADEKGIRYHFGFDFSRLFGGGDFWGGLEILAEYDRPEGDDADWGVDLSYTHRFGEATATGSSATTEGFDPRAHFFDPVRREYAQRIDRVTVGTVNVNDVLVTAVAGGGSVGVEPVTVGGPEAMYRSSEAVTIVSNADSELEARRKGFWMLDVSADTELSFMEAGSQLSLSRGSVGISRSDGIVSANSGSVMVDFSGVVSMTLASLVVAVATTQATVTTTLTYVNLWHGEVAVTMAGVQASLFSLTISGESRAIVASEGSTITVTPITMGAATMTLLAGVTGDLYTLMATETDGEPNALEFNFSPTISGWTVGRKGGVKGGVIGRSSPLEKGMERLFVEVSDPYSETQRWEIVVNGVSIPTAPVESLYYVPQNSGRTVLLTLQAQDGASTSYVLTPTPANSVFDLDASSNEVSFLGTSALGHYDLTVEIDDGQQITDDGQAVVSVLVYGPLVISPSSLPIFTLAAGRTGDIQTMTVSGGSGNYSLSVSSGRSGSLLRMSSGNALNLGSPLSSLGTGLVTLMATLGASDNDIDGLSAPPVTAVLLGVPALSLTSDVTSDVVLLTSAAGDMPLLTLADLLAAVGGGLPPYQLGTPTMTDGITLSAGVLRLSSQGVADEMRAATIRVTDGTTFNTLDFTLRVMFEPPFGFRNAATVLAVAEDYSGVVQTLTAAAIGVTATVTYSTATPDVAVGGSDGVLSLATPLAGNDKGVTVTATDGNLTVSHVLTLRSVSPLVLSLPPTLYVPGSEDFWSTPGPLTVTGGDGGGATVFQSFSGGSGNWYNIEPTGGVNVAPFSARQSGSSEAAFTVSVSQPAVIGGRTATGVLNIFIYDSLSVASLPTLTVEIGRTGAIAGGVVMPAGGSGSYGFSVAVGGATVTAGADGALRLLTAVTMTTTLSVVVAVTDQVLTALAVSVTAVLESRFVDRVSLAAFETRHYVIRVEGEGESRPGQPPASSSTLLVVLTVAGGSDAVHEWGEAAGTDADGLFSVSSTTGVATVQVVGHPGTISTVSYTITVGRDEAVGVTTALTVVFYNEGLAFLNPRVAVNVFTGVTGVVHTVMTRAGTGSGDVGYSLVSPAYSSGNGDRPITLTLLAGGVLGLQTPLVGADSSDIEVTVVAVDNNLDVKVTQVLALTAIVTVPDVEVTASGTGNGVLSGGVAATVTAGGAAFEYLSSVVAAPITAITETGGQLRFVESRWTVAVQGDSTVVFRENSRQVVLLGGGAEVDRRGGITSFSSPFVTVHLLGTRVSMRYVAGGITYVNLLEGTVSINTGSPWGNYLSLSFGGTSRDLKAVIVPDGGTPQTVVPPLVGVTVTAAGGSGVLSGGVMATVTAGGAAAEFASSLAVTASVAAESQLRFVSRSWNFDAAPGRVLPGTGVVPSPGTVALRNNGSEIYLEGLKLSLAVDSGVNLVGSRFVTVRFDGAVDMEMRWPFGASQRGNPLGGLGWGFVTGLDAGYTVSNTYVGLRRGTVTIHVSGATEHLDRFEILREGTVTTRVGAVEAYLEYFRFLSREGTRAVVVPDGGTPVTVVPLKTGGMVTVRGMRGLSDYRVTGTVTVGNPTRVNLFTLSADLVGGASDRTYAFEPSAPTGWSVSADGVISFAETAGAGGLTVTTTMVAATVTVQVHDDYHDFGDEEDWVVRFELNNPLMLEAAAASVFSTAGYVGPLLTLAASGGFPPYRYLLSPTHSTPGVAVDESTGVVSADGTSPVNADGHMVSVSVVDDSGFSRSLQFVYRVYSAPRFPGATVTMRMSSAEFNDGGTLGGGGLFQVPVARGGSGVFQYQYGAFEQPSGLILLLDQTIEGNRNVKQIGAYEATSSFTIGATVTAVDQVLGNRLTMILFVEVVKTPEVDNLEDLYYAEAGAAAVTLLSLDIDDAGTVSPEIALLGHDYTLAADTTLVLISLPATPTLLMLTLQAYDTDVAASERLTATYPFEVRVHRGGSLRVDEPPFPSFRAPGGISPSENVLGISDIGRFFAGQPPFQFEIGVVLIDALTVIGDAIYVKSGSSNILPGTALQANLVVTDQGTTTLTVAITANYVAPLSYDYVGPVTVAVQEDRAGSVFVPAPAPTLGSGEFDYSVVSPAFRADGRAVSLSGGAGVTLHEGLPRDQTLTVTMVVRDARAGFPGSATLTLAFVTPGPYSVTLSESWHTRLRLDDGMRSIARLAVGGFPGSLVVSVSHPNFFYEPADDGSGGLLRAAPPPNGGQHTVSVSFSSDLPGLPPTSMAVYTLEWVGENAIYLIGGNRDRLPDSSTGTNFRRDVQRFDGRRWRASGNLTSAREHAAALHKGRGWVLGGSFDGRVYQSSNVWGRWPALYTDDTAWRNMTGSEMVSHGGTLWIIAGKLNAGAAGSTKNVWRLDESTNRFTLAATAQFSRRQLHEAVSYAGSLWVLGGVANSNSYNSAIANVWASADGISWRRVGDLPSRRFEHQVAVHAGSMYLYGGRDGSGVNSSGAVWASADGANWRLAGTHPAGRREGHQMVSSGGNLWVIGGYENDSDKRVKDTYVWYSPDGARWTRGVQMPEGKGRDQHQVIVRPRPLPDGAPEPVGLSAEGAASSYHVTVGTTTPVDLFTLSIGGGVGGASINVDIVDDANVVGWKTLAERVIQVTAVGSDGDVATVTVAVSDGTPDSIEVVFTISFALALSAGGVAPSYEITVGTTTPVDLFTLSIGGGLGASRNVEIVDSANVVGWNLNVEERVIQVTALGSAGDVATVTLVVRDSTPDSVEVVFTISFVASTGFVPDEGGSEGDGQQWFVAMADFIPAGERARVGGVFRYSNGEGDGGFLFRYGRMPLMDRVARASG